MHELLKRDKYCYEQSLSLYLKEKKVSPSQVFVELVSRLGSMETKRCLPLFSSGSGITEC